MKSSLEGLNSKCEQVEKNVQPLSYVNWDYSVWGKERNKN